MRLEPNDIVNVGVSGVNELYTIDGISVQIGINETDAVFDMNLEVHNAD
jgi:hypothetical protein